MTQTPIPFTPDNSEPQRVFYSPGELPDTITVKVVWPKHTVLYPNVPTHMLDTLVPKITEGLNLVE